MSHVISRPNRNADANLLSSASLSAATSLACIYSMPSFPSFHDASTQAIVRLGFGFVKIRPYVIFAIFADTALSPVHIQKRLFHSRV